jgi:AraC-like DNA-binding protein
MRDTLYAHVCKLLQEIFHEYYEKPMGYQLAIKSKLYDLMLVLLRGIPKVDHNIPSTKAKHICDFILKNFDDPDLALEEAADALNLNKFYFAHLFKKYMGHSFHSYLTTTRVNFAKRYLIETEMPITDIAFHSGFNSLQTFNRVFKTMTGFTPGNYRRENNSMPSPITSLER